MHTMETNLNLNCRADWLLSQEADLYSINYTASKRLINTGQNLLSILFVSVEVTCQGIKKKLPETLQNTNFRIKN